MNCQNCGQIVPDTANVCGYCGHRLKGEAVDVHQLQDLEINAQISEINTNSVSNVSSSKVKKQLSWTFVLLWLGCFVIGTAPSRFLAVLIGTIIGLDFYNLPSDWETVIEFLVAGLVVGLLQWLILRKKVGVSIAWIALTGMGLFIGESLTYLTRNNNFLLLALSGVIFSIGQWFLLRRLIPKGTWWMVINAAAQLIAGKFYFIKSFNVLFGLMTGIGLLWLLRNTLETPFSKSRKN